VQVSEDDKETVASAVKEALEWMDDNQEAGACVVEVGAHGLMGVRACTGMGTGCTHVQRAQSSWQQCSAPCMPAQGRGATPALHTPLAHCIARAMTLTLTSTPIFTLVHTPLHT